MRSGAEAVMRLGVPVLTSMMIGVSAGLIAAVTEAEELRSSCASSVQVSAHESRVSAEQRFDLAHQGADGLGEKQFAAADGLRQQFIQVDEDGDGRISRDEWLRWFGPALADKAADGQASGPN